MTVFLIFVLDACMRSWAGGSVVQCQKEATRLLVEMPHADLVLAGKGESRLSVIISLGHCCSRAHLVSACLLLSMCVWNACSCLFTSAF